MNTVAKKIQPESANAWVPESSTPTVQPSAIIDDQPKSTPPISAVKPFFTVMDCHENLLPASAAAREAKTIPTMSHPLLVTVELMTAIQPFITSKPSSVSGRYPRSLNTVRAVVLNCRVTPSGSIRR